MEHLSAGRPDPGVSRRSAIATIGKAAAAVIAAGAATAVRPLTVSATSAHAVTDRIIGTSVRGRDIVARTCTPASPARRVVVVGGVHGNEHAGVNIVDHLLARTDLPADLELVGIRCLNPDGAAAGTRRNARAVDLNRNFPVAWGLPTRGERRGDPGPSPLSEPESAAIATYSTGLAASLPTAFVWLHNPLGWVAPIADNPEAGWYANQWAATTRLSVRRVTRVPGGGETFTAGLGPSILVEVRGWGIDVGRHLDGFRAAFG